MTRLQKIMAYVALGMGLVVSAPYVVGLIESTSLAGHVCVPLESVPPEERGPEAHWFVAVNDAWTPDPGLGAVAADAGGVCYDYALSSTKVGAWRLMAAHGAPYFKARWAQAVLGAGPTMLKGWRSYRDVKADCLSLLSAAQCVGLMREINDCWEIGNGDLCIGGRLYGTGKGGYTTCTPDGTMSPVACMLAYGQTEGGVE